MRADYSVHDISHILGLPLPDVRRCLRAALLPAPRRTGGYSFQDLILLRTCRSLIDAKIAVPRIRRLLQSLKNQIPSDRHLSTIRIYADGRRVVVWDGRAQWQPDSGQFMFSFDASEFVGQYQRPEQLAQSRTRTASQWCRLGQQLTETSGGEAKQAYLEAILVDPTYTPAHILLGQAYWAEQQWRQAESCFRQVCRSDPHDSQAFYRLGQVLEKLDKPVAAIQAYQDAIERNARFYEAHYHLALLYESQGRSAAAIRHFHIARRLTGKR